MFNVNNKDTRKAFCCLPASNYEFKDNNKDTRCEICSMLTIKTPERRSAVFIVNFEHISHIGLVLLLLTLSR